MSAGRFDVAREAPDLRGLAGIVGRPCAGLAAWLGPPTADRAAGGERWLVWRWKGLTLRVRGGAGPRGRVSGWTASLERPAATLLEAAAPLGLWPACAPDVDASAVSEPLLRRAVLDPEGGPPRTCTATVRNGRITALTLFDEPPEWV